MLSRVAERLYWMARYLERAEDTARLTNAYSHLILDMPTGAEPGWKLLIDTIDAHVSYHKRYKVFNERNVIKFLLADVDNNSSIRHAIKQARENVRTARDILPAQAWELVNECYLFVNEAAPQSVARQNRYEFLEEVISRTQEIHGLIDSTVLRDQGLWFIELGQYIERADMTSRVVDVAAGAILAQTSNARENKSRADNIMPAIPLLWANLLKSLSATSAYRRKVGPLLGPTEVVDFLFRSSQFPRSIAFCVNQIEENIGLLRGPKGLLRYVRNTAYNVLEFDAAKGSPGDLHQFIDELQEQLAEIHGGCHEAWFELPDRSSGDA
ncbi:MAG: alpha-E domain-containing protein [Pseudomonadota bacterium]